jgi:rRNA maturation RNase YbeY
LLKINQEYLKHNTYTDIITFNLSEDETVIGEIYISVKRVKENAARLGSGFREELLRVMIHGILHLCGYTDQNKENQLIIRAKEDEYLRKFKRST